MTDSTPSVAELEAVIQADREFYISLLKRSQETLLLEGMQVPDARIVAYAIPASDPSYPIWTFKNEHRLANYLAVRKVM